MRILKTVALSLICIIFLAGSVSAESTGQEKLMAKRAATVDAYRNLAERVNGLQINAQTYVRDFVAASDQVNTALDAFLKGARVSNVRYLPDGTCEVDVELGVKELVTELETIKKQTGFLIFWQTVYFNKITEYYKESTIKATGSGVPGGVKAEASKTSTITENIPGWENVTPQGRLMAQRAALVDAYRNLAERVNGLQINAQTYVRDFVTASDQVQTQLNTWLRGVQPKGAYRYLPDGICEVDVEIGVRELVRELETIKKQTGFLIFWQTVYFDKITEYYKDSFVKATGSGVPPEKYSAPTAQAAAAVPVWSSRKEIATGTGVPPKDATGAEARVMAERAAKLDGLRNLAEKVYGVKIDSATTVKDFVTKNDQIKAEVEAFLRGAEVSDTRYKDDGSVEVDVSVDMNGVWGILKKAQ